MSTPSGPQVNTREDGWLPIAEHGLIGDLRTCALVGSEGSIDWFCAPRFDSPSIFGSILDQDKGGSWAMHPTGDVTRTQQYYFPDSNILVTRFLTDAGVTELHDFMPVLAARDPDHHQRLVRRVVVVRGRAELNMRLAARPDYGQASPQLEQVDEVGVRIKDGEVELGLSSTIDLDIEGDDVTATMSMSEGDSALFVLEVLEQGEEMQGSTEEDIDRLFDATAAFWRTWLSQSTYTGRWRERVNRSALTLKLMCHEPSGGIIAAPTTSLPEDIGGERNWDYRYVWMRDAAFSLYALLRLGFTDEAGSFIRWLSKRLGETPMDDELGPLRVLYDLDGKVPVTEHQLEHLSGYRDSQPVRVGNAAVDQLQLDIYGELIDSVYLFNKYGPGISAAAWDDLTRIVDWVLDNWDRDDAGMWEIRDEPKAHTTSRLMVWVALERMIRVARQRGLPGDLARWAEVRDKVYHRIMDHCWDDNVGAFMQYEGSDVLDAGVLLMPMVKFVAPDDPRFVSTLDAIEERLVADSLVFRYDHEASPDGVDGEEGTFSLCSFWYVEALTRVGRLDDARLALEKMFTYANHLGLYAEQVGLNGEQLGNFPQAFTHLSQISAVLNLDRALN